MGDKDKDYKIVITDIVDLNEYKPLVICRSCGDFSKCNPKCGMFYRIMKQKRDA